MEIEFPIEFLIEGTPVSLQAKRSASRDEWKDRIKEASVKSIPSPHFVSGDRMAVTVYYFPDGPMQGDIDNIIKPILDALSRHIYLDDHQVERVVVQKFEPGNAFSFDNPSEIFAEALAGPRPISYLRVSNDPHEGFS